jgi:hypothetical protein
MIDRLIERLKGVLRLEGATFEEIEQDRGAIVEALIVVVLVAIAALIGSVGNEGERGLVSGVTGAIVGWIVFSAICYVVGTHLLASLETRSSWGELLRVLGYAEAPNAVAIVAFIPLVGGVVAVIGAVWALLAAILGIRQALEVPYARAAGIAVIAWVIRLVLLFLIGLIFDVSALVFSVF